MFAVRIVLEFEVFLFLSIIVQLIFFAVCLAMHLGISSLTIRWCCEMASKIRAL